MTLALVFIHQNRNQRGNSEEVGSSLNTKRNKPSLEESYEIKKEVFFNKDYEPYAIARDEAFAKCWIKRYSFFF
jgi:deoxyribodipyrimidine photo-lyase